MFFNQGIPYLSLTISWSLPKSVSTLIMEDLNIA